MCKREKVCASVIDIVVIELSVLSSRCRCRGCDEKTGSPGIEKGEEDARPNDEARDQEEHQLRAILVPADHKHPPRSHNAVARRRRRGEL